MKGQGRLMCPNPYCGASTDYYTIDALARDAGALLAALDGETLPKELAQAATLLATLLGQDLETDDTGTFRIARRVASERVISTVDPDARHDHKTRVRSFDGYKGHLALDPGSELVTATAVTPGDSGDAAAAPELLEADLEAGRSDTDEPLTVYADAAYGSGELLETLETAGASLRIKVQPPTAQGGRFSKDDFRVDTEATTVTCPAGLTVALPARQRGHRHLRGRLCGLSAGHPLHHREGRTEHRGGTP